MGFSPGVVLLSVPYDCVALGGRGGSDKASISGNPYFTVPPRTANYVVLKYRIEMLFTSITTTLYTKAYPQSVLSVLWYPCVFRSITQIGDTGH